MVPPNMQSSEIGAKFNFEDVTFHQGKRLVVRPDIKAQLKDGDSLIHIAKIGSDFQTGLGKMSQKKQRGLRCFFPWAYWWKLKHRKCRNQSFQKLSSLCKHFWDFWISSFKPLGIIEGSEQPKVSRHLQVQGECKVMLHFIFQMVITLNFRRSFDLWTENFDKTMTANVHLLIAHADLYLKYVWIKLLALLCHFNL